MEGIDCHEVKRQDLTPLPWWRRDGAFNHSLPSVVFRDLRAAFPVDRCVVAFRCNALAIAADDGPRGKRQDMIPVLF